MHLQALGEQVGGGLVRAASTASNSEPRRAGHGLLTGHETPDSISVAFGASSSSPIEDRAANSL